MHKHKNLITLINMMELIKKNKIKGIPNKLVVSGVGGPVKDKLISIIKEKDLEDTVIVTGFVSNSDRNLLIKNSNCFSKVDGISQGLIELEILDSFLKV